MIRRHARQILGPVLAALACAYFCIHALAGDGGVAALWERRAEIAAMQERLDAARAHRTDLEMAVRRLDPADPDLDLFGELIRARYGYLRTDESRVPIEVDHG